MTAEPQIQESWQDGDIEVSYEDYGDFGASYEDYGVLPEGYGESLEDPVEKTHTALLEDQHRKKQFAKHAWVKVVRETNNTYTESVTDTDKSKTKNGGQAQDENSTANVDHPATSGGGVKTERKKAKEKQGATERDDGDSAFSRRKPRRKNFVETHWPSGSELEVEDDSSADLAEEVLVSLINN